MLWFQGPVSEAIVKSKRVRSVFMVFITGDDEDSKKMDTVLDNEQITDVCSRDCTAMKLHVNSVEGKQFASLYPVVCVPCTYFINGNGIPLEVIGGCLSEDQFLEKVKETIKKHRIDFPKLEPESSLGAGSSSQSVPSQSDAVVGGSSDSSPDIVERVARAKQLVAEKRKERQENEKEDAKRKEIDRRKDGKQLTKAKTEREELLAQQMAERVRLEKAKDRAAREAIRQKIAQDKAERAARQEIEKKERLNVAARIDPHLSANDPAVQFSNVRLQFRLPDGSSVTQSFPLDTTLETAREFICSRMNFTKGITFWTTFPRKHLGDEDFPKTLKELGLAPSAALVVDPSSTSSSSKQSGNSSNLSLSSVISLIFVPFLALLSFFKMLLFASPQQTRGAVQENNQQTSDSAHTSASTSSNSEVRRRARDSGKSEDDFKKEGKIHSFKQKDNDDDENNTWNGNSTQQM